MSTPGLDATHDAAAVSWVPGDADFGPANLPLCVFSPPGRSEPRGGTRIGDFLLDLGALADALRGAAATAAEAAAGPVLNPLFELGAGPRRALRAALHALVTDPAGRAVVEPVLSPVEGSTLHLPARIGDYTDFYAGRFHAERVGRQFRPDNPLLPNYDWVPIGYHGRASTVRVSGSPVVRPRGQLKAPDADAPVFAPSRRLDFELELGVWLGASPVPDGVPGIDRAAEQVAGFCLLDDWSARDIQAWEYQPLGPFLAKSFATTVSAYVVTPEALAPFRTALRRPEGGPEPLPYLADPADLASGGLDVELEVALSTPAMRAAGRPDAVVSRSSTTHLYWTVAQLIAHHSSGGCQLQAGDLLGTGTISSPDESGLGSLLELTSGGREPLELPGGERRAFLEDGDEVVLRARARREGAAPIGFGECRGRVLPAPG